ncbi:La-like protein, partial [Trifolium medium]|nr:La-like protein [Trifolium medium]
MFTAQYIDFNMGDESGFIRFDEPEAAQKARTAAVLSEIGGLVVKNFIAILDPVTGEAEKEYWSKLRGKQDQRRESFSNRGRGGRHGRGGKNFRHRDNDSGGGRPNKFRKFMQR